MQPEEASSPSESSLPALISVGMTETLLQQVEELFESDRGWGWGPRPWQHRWYEPETLLQQVEELLAEAEGGVDQEDVDQRLDRRLDGHPWHPEQQPRWRRLEGRRRSLCDERDAELQRGGEAKPVGGRPAAASGVKLQPSATPHPPWTPFTGRSTRIPVFDDPGVVDDLGRGLEELIEQYSPRIQLGLPKGRPANTEQLQHCRAPEVLDEPQQE